MKENLRKVLELYSKNLPLQRKPGIVPPGNRNTLRTRLVSPVHFQGSSPQLRTFDTSHGDTGLDLLRSVCFIFISCLFLSSCFTHDGWE